MNGDKQPTIHFNNSTKMEVSFSTQIKNSTGALVEIPKGILEGDKLTIQTEGQVIMIPWSSIKYVEASALPAAALPIGAIRGAKILTTTESVPK